MTDGAPLARILLVDDEVFILKTLLRVLRNLFEIETASDPQQALKKLDNDEPYQVIVSDLRMPTMDGFELLSIVREKHPDVVRIILTGNMEDEDLLQSKLKHELFSMIHKPWERDELIATLKKAVKYAQENGN